MSHAMNKATTKQKRARNGVGSGEFVRVRLSLTHEESERLLYLVRDAANEPSDMDHKTLLSICEKVEAATAHPNTKPSGA